ncbi:bifunctional DNA primase/polymerase [Streptodolium elevatio]|uniref:Bifunctional DNA primase/polymerase n=1 Tax=Streptodolium elevatio TaxID=3157996 RepID=A0ABV3DFT0_9ACTN
MRYYRQGWFCLAHAPVIRPPASGIPGTLRVLVTGSRTWNEPGRVRVALDALLTRAPTGMTVVHGACPRGADRHAADWARDHADKGVTEEPHPADWNQHGRRAGPVRNAAMVALGADRCAAFIRDDSPGASHCARTAELAGIPTHRHTATTSRPAATPARKDSHMHRPNLKAAALACAERGWHVFPLVPGAKRPAVTDWENRATTDTARITRCWDHAPYNIGIACGPSGLVVVDLDTAKDGEEPKEPWSREDVTCGADVLAVLAKNAEAPYPDSTFAVSTPSGGAHLYFRAQDGADLRNTAGRIGWKIDTRANGGYVVANGSIVDGRSYATRVDEDPIPLPGWLYGHLRPEQRIPKVTPPTPHLKPAYANAALLGEISRVESTKEGGRNTALYEAARNLGKFVAFGDLPRHEVEERLLIAALASGLGEREAARSIRAALDYSIARYPHGREAA